MFFGMNNLVACIILTAQIIIIKEYPIEFVQYFMIYKWCKLLEGLNHPLHTCLYFSAQQTP